MGLLQHIPQFISKHTTIPEFKYLIVNKSAKIRHFSDEIPPKSDKTGRPVGDLFLKKHAYFSPRR